MVFIYEMGLIKYISRVWGALSEQIPSKWGLSLLLYSFCVSLSLSSGPYRCGNVSRYQSGSDTRPRPQIHLSSAQARLL